MSETFLRHIDLLGLVPLRPRKASVRDLHRRLQGYGHTIDVRSIERDLIKLSGRLPLARDGGKPAGWCWTERHRGFAPMDPSSALAHQLVARFLEPLLPRRLASAMAPTLEDARAVLDELSGRPLARWSKLIAVVPQQQALLPPTVANEVMEVVSEALLAGCRCEVGYRSAQAPRARRTVLSPLGLVLHGGLPYLVATAWDYDDPRIFALHRMSRPRLLDKQPVTPPPGFDLDRYVNTQRQFDQPRGGVLRLELRVSEWLANHLDERRLSADQQITRPPHRAANVAAADEHNERPMRVRATVADTEQLRWWLRSFGPGVEVRRPVALRRELAAEYAALAKTYGGRTG
ncbi:MAG TPA: WYL domain-containing protein [Rhodanobacteraceae bacterium]|nr:WYL domain-containing protein [Rhodanobacteraceae bacterium]